MIQIKKNTKVLIVEDEIIIGEDLKYRLQQFGYTVCACVTSGEEALNVVETEEPDIILMDIVLSGRLDGIATAELIRSRRETPVIFITAYAEEEKLERAKLTLPFGYILKPFQDRDVKVTVDMALYASKVDLERRKAEESLKLAEERLRIIFEKSKDAVFLISVKGEFVDVNEAAVHLTGFSKTELLTMSIPDLYDNLDVKAFNRYFGRIMAGESIVSETIITRKDGAKRYTEFSNTRVSIGGVDYMHSTARDITERKQMEQALKESERKYRQLFNHAPAGIYEVDFINGRFTAINEVIAEYTGYSREELLTMDAINILSEESRPVFLERLVKMLSGEPVENNVIYNLNCKNGREFSVMLNARYTFEEGRITGASVVVHDVSDLKRMEKALEKSEKQYRLIVENVQEGICVIQNGRVRYVNPSALFITGYSLEEVSGKKLSLFIHESDMNAAGKIQHNLSEAESIKDTYVIRVKRRDGKMLAVKMNCIVVDWEDKPALLVFFTDSAVH